MRMALTAAIRMDVAASLQVESSSSHPGLRNGGGRSSSKSENMNDKKPPAASIMGSVGNASAEIVHSNNVQEYSLATPSYSVSSSQATCGGQSNTSTTDTDTDMTRNPERLKRCRERNRIHARKTRQRKKEQMQTLQNRAEELKEEQMRLKQAINEKNTASILVGLFSSKDNRGEKRIEDPQIEELLRRPTDEIPDASKLPELPALILPGQHNSRKLHATPETPTSGGASQQAAEKKKGLPDDGIDYTLLGKDRSQCTPAELDQIRRERNRMHAKRTRDRKRLFMEEMSDMCKKLETENALLARHLEGLQGHNCPSLFQPPSSTSQPNQNHSVVSPTLSSTSAGITPPAIETTEQAEEKSTKPSSSCPPSYSATVPVSEHGVTLDQIKTLLDAAGRFTSESAASAVSASEGGSLSGSDQEHDDQHPPPSKRQRVNSDDDSTLGGSFAKPLATTTLFSV